MYVITPGAYPVQEQQTGGSVWRENSRELYNYLRRDMRDATSERKRLYPVNWSQHVLRTVPFVWAIARELATAYMQPPSRRFVGKDGEPLADDLVALIEAEYARAHVDEVMRTAHRHLVALNNATIWVWPTESGDLRLTLIAPHEQEVELRHPFALHEDDVGMWRWRIAMPVKSAPSTSVYAVGVVTHESAVWEATGELNGMGIYAEDGSMPFETLPVVMLRGTPPGPGEWWAPVPHDILDAQRAMNHDLTDVGHIARLQGYGQPYVRGYSSGETKDMQLGPETVIGLSGDTAEFGFASASPALDGYVTQVREYVTQVIGMNGMNPATFLKSAGITALAKQVELIDRENYRQEFKGILKAAEQRLYDVMRAVINYQRGAELWPEATVEVDYREPIVPADPLHDAQALQMLVELGQTGRVRARAQRDGVSLEEAARRMGQDRELDGGFSVGDVVEMGQPDVQPADQVVEMSAPAPEAQPMPADGAPPSLDVAPSADVQKAALNGAQVAELKALIVSVAMGEIPADTARAVILAAYPIDPASVDDMLSSLSGFTPRTPGA